MSLPTVVVVASSRFNATSKEVMMSATRVGKTLRCVSLQSMMSSKSSHQQIVAPMMGQAARQLLRSFTDVGERP
jgi:hypothetical protein